MPRKARVIGMTTNNEMHNLTASASAIVPRCKPAYAKTVLASITRFLFSSHDGSSSSELGFRIGSSV